MTTETETAFTGDSRVQDVMQDPAFAGFGRLIFPVDMRIDDALALNDVEEILPWYSEVNPERTVSIVNEMKTRVKQGETIFYDIYTDEEKAKDPAKKDTGLFFFRGNPGEKFAITNAGGGFAYVAAMHDSFPHMQELARRGYNAFALIYRRGPRLPAKIWPGPSRSSMNIRKNCRWIPMGIHCGAVPPEPAWQPGLVLMELRHLEKENIRHREL